MRLVVHDYSGHPFQVQLSRALARRGHDVLHLHCSSYVTGKGALVRRDDDPPTFATDAVDLGETFVKYSYGKRVLQERRYAALCADRIAAHRPDAVLCSNTPLLAHRLLQPRVQRTGASFVFWQQDVYSVAMSNAAAAVPVVGGLAGAALRRMERRLLAASDEVVVISEDFVPILREWDIPRERVTVLENWAPLDELPQAPRANAWSAEHGLDGRSVLLYSGTLGLKHDPALLLELARAAQARDDAVVVVISEGLGADWLREHGRDVPALVQLPFQPFARLPEVLGTADVLLAILEPEASVFSVPSKVLSYHCAGRPILAAIPPENLAARIIERAGSGVVTAPGDAAGFVAAAHGLLDAPEVRSAMGAAARRYAEVTFDIEDITDRFENIFRRIRRDSTPTTLEER